MKDNSSKTRELVSEGGNFLRPLLINLLKTPAIDSRMQKHKMNEGEDAVLCERNFGPSRPSP